MAFIAGRLAVGPDALELAQARDRRNDRIGAVGQDDVIGGVAHAVDLDHAWAGQSAAAAQQVDAVVGQPALLSGVGVVRDHEVTPRERRLDVDLGARRCLARALHSLAGAQQGLRGDARPVGALAPHQLALDERDPQPAFGKRTGAVLARGAAADHDHVVVLAQVAAPAPASCCEPVIHTRRS